MAMYQVVLIVIALALGGVLFYLLFLGAERGKQIPELGPSSAVLCAATPGVKTPDIDNDGLKDTCDNCVCEENAGCRNMEYDLSNPLKPTVKNKRDDEDQDGLPKACDEDDEDAEKTGWSAACKDNLRETASGKRCVIS